MPKSYASTVVSSSADEVWAFLRDFGNLDEWLPGIESCEIEGGGTAAAGAVRSVDGAGGHFRERLSALDDAERSAIYEILECPLPIRNHRGTYRVSPVTDTGQAFIEWSATFEADAENEAKMAKIFTKGILTPGLEALRKRFG